MRYFHLVFIILVSFKIQSAPSNACHQFYNSNSRSKAFLSLGEGSNEVRYSIDAVSRENTHRLKQELGSMSSAEQILFAKVLAIPTLVTHRTSNAALVEILADGGLYSKSELLSTQENATQYKVTQANDYMTTPRAEDLLYDASEFVFATVSASGWRGDVRYGPVSVIVKNSHWLSEGWGSEHSGWFYFKKAAALLGIALSYSNPDPRLIDVTANGFKNEVFAARDFQTVSAIRTIQHLRTKQTAAIEKLGQFSDADLIQWMSDQQLGYLEGKMRRIQIKDIERIEVPRAEYSEFIRLLEGQLSQFQIPVVIVD